MATDSLQAASAPPLVVGSGKSAEHSPKILFKSSTSSTAPTSSTGATRPPDPLVDSPETAVVLISHGPAGRKVLIDRADIKLPRCGPGVTASGAPAPTRASAVSSGRRLAGSLCPGWAGSHAYLAADLPPAPPLRPKGCRVIACPCADILAPSSSS
jgi:hypothetical protein